MEAATLDKQIISIKFYNPVDVKEHLHALIHHSKTTSAAHLQICIIVWLIFILTGEDTVP